jgi:hypothetical protein
MVQNERVFCSRMPVSLEPNSPDWTKSAVISAVRPRRNAGRLNKRPSFRAIANILSQGNIAIQFSRPRPARTNCQARNRLRKRRKSRIGTLSVAKPQNVNYVPKAGA